jgi:hypothetical protein
MLECASVGTSSCSSGSSRTGQATNKNGPLSSLGQHLSVAALRHYASDSYANTVDSGSSCHIHTAIRQHYRHVSILSVLRCKYRWARDAAGINVCHFIESVLHVHLHIGTISTPTQICLIVRMSQSIESEENGRSSNRSSIRIESVVGRYCFKFFFLLWLLMCLVLFLLASEFNPADYWYKDLKNQSTYIIETRWWYPLFSGTW